MNLTLDQLVGASRLRGHELQWEFCPTCGAGGWHFSVNLRTGLWNCFAGRHRGGGGRILDADLLRARYVGAGNSTSVYTGSIEIPEIQEILLPDTSTITTGTLASKYLLERGITLDTATQLSLRDWKEEYRILIPFFNEVYNACYYTARDYLGTSSRKYLNAASPRCLYQPTSITAPPNPGHGGDDGRGRRPVVVVEGPLDAVAIWQAASGQWDVVALAGRDVPAHCAVQLRRLVQGRRVLVWLDNDAAGRAAGVAVTAQVRPHAESVVTMVDWHGACKDPADMAPSEIADVLRGSER